MAKNFSSVGFTILVLVLVMASTGFLKSEAAPCSDAPCSSTDAKTIYAECGDVPFLGTNADCCECCKKLLLPPPVLLCWAAVEGTDNHCHCYRKDV